MKRLWRRLRQLHHEDPLFVVLIFFGAIALYLLYLIPVIIMMNFDTTPDATWEHCLPSKLHGRICAKK